jgi:hypothetical protein
MASKQTILHGASIERSLDGVDWERIPEARGIAVPATATDYQEVTSLDSEGGYREYIPGLRDTGEVSIPCGYTSEGYRQQYDDMNIARATGTPIHYRATMPVQRGQVTGDVHTFRGYPTVAVEGTDVAGPPTMTVTIRTTGEPEFVEGDAEDLGGGE